MRRMRVPAAVIAVAALGLAACGNGTTTATTVPLYSLRRDGAPGHCLLGGDGVYSRVDCSTAHTIEVSSTLDYPDDAVYPGGGGGLPLQFFEDCDVGFAAYVGVSPDRSPVPAGELRSVPIIPSVAVWNDGDRHVVCTVRGERPWSGSVRDLGALTPPGLPATDVASGGSSAC